jgi:hypothetical protein
MVFSLESDQPPDHARIVARRVEFGASTAAALARASRVDPIAADGRMPDDGENEQG